MLVELRPCFLPLWYHRGFQPGSHSVEAAPGQNRILAKDEERQRCATQFGEYLIGWELLLKGGRFVRELPDSPFGWPGP